MVKYSQNLGNKRLNEDEGELLYKASQFTTKRIENPEDHDISNNLADLPINEEPPEAIVEGGLHEVQTSATAVENPVSDPIYENSFPCS